MAETSPEQDVTLSVRGKVAIITLDREKKLNALDQDRYYRLACLMNEVAGMPEVVITVLTGKGRFFSAGADVTASRTPPASEDKQRHFLRSFVANNLHITHAFYSHPKILVTALNGPAVGLSAALVAYSDFIYAAPHAYILTPFTSLGLVAEGGSSVAFVERLGISKANEALIMSKRIPAIDLLHCGFVNGIIEGATDQKDSSVFLGKVLKEVQERLGDHLNGDSMLKVKAMIRAPSRSKMHEMGAVEVFGGLQRFMSGIPQEEFRKIASGEKKHKL